MEDSSKGTQSPQTGEAQGEQLGPDEEMTRLKVEISEAKAMAERNLDMAKRIQAEFDNYKKRAQRDKEEQVKAANDRLLCELLSFLDDFDRALSSKATPEEFRQGVGSIQENLRSMLQSKGLVETPCSKFDPALHEALCVGEGEE
ncbi:MAG: nucleotide exchange factor GrpE, partial [Methanomassiliicoccales archaeon]|nr:nucleotide exchange factor GrpE [Methanomassiliicoccales archaeon]